MRIIKAIRNAKRLEKENAELRKDIEEALRELQKENTELRKVIEEALQDLQDSECPPGVRILSTSIRLEMALKKDPAEVSSSGESKRQ